MKRVQIEHSERILILEDSPYRIEWFRHELPRATVVRNPLICIQALLARDFGTVFLDADVPCPLNTNGLVVARFLVMRRFTGRVIVHTANAGAAFTMTRMLAAAKVDVAMLEFGSFIVEETPLSL